LTAIAKRPDGRVTLELDDDGGLSYLFHDLVATGRVRVADARFADARYADARFADARFAEARWQPTAGAVPSRIAAPGSPPRVIDAELIDEEVSAPAEPARRMVR
jgi:hypothetical protein